MRQRSRCLPAALAAALAAAPLLAGCGELPRPFQPEAKGGNDLLLLPDRYGITVSPATGATPEGDGALAAAMAEALRKENVPATVGAGNARTRWLLGRVERLGAVAGTLRLRLTWELYEADGTPSGRHDSTVTVAEDAWRKGEAAALTRAVQPSAARFARLVQGEPVRETKLAGFPVGTRVVVAPVSGGPGDAARALTAAMAAQLRQRELPLAEQARPGDVVIAGELRLGPKNGPARPLEVVWVVRRHGDAGSDAKSARLGDLRQANTVPQAQIDQGWPRLAGLIARAAAPGVLQVLEQAAPAR